MKTLYDDIDNLNWISFDRYEAKDNPQYDNLISQLNTWSDDPNMKKFITENDLGEDMDFWFKLVNDTDLFFATNSQDELVSCVLISHSRPLMKKDELLDYIANNHHIHKLPTLDIPEEKFLTEPEVVDLLLNSDNENIYIEYILVNPKFQGRGIATRFYKKIQENMEFFGGNKDINLIQLSINNENIASRKSIIKNGFKRMKPAYYEDNIYATYFLRVKKPTKELTPDEKF